MQKRQPNYNSLYNKSKSYIKRLKIKSYSKYKRLEDTLLTLNQFNITDHHNIIILNLKKEINFYFNQNIELNELYHRYKDYHNENLSQLENNKVFNNIIIGLNKYKGNKYFL